MSKVNHRANLWQVRPCLTKGEDCTFSLNALKATVRGQLRNIKIFSIAANYITTVKTERQTVTHAKKGNLQLKSLRTY